MTATSEGSDKRPDPRLCDAASARPNAMDVALRRKALAAHDLRFARPVDLNERGTNAMAGGDGQAIGSGVAASFDGQVKRGRVLELSDGHAAVRIAADLCRRRARGAP